MLGGPPRAIGACRIGVFVALLAFLHPLRHARFRRVWSGQAISAIGDGISVVALAGAVLAHHSAATLGLVLGAMSVARIAVALVGGVLADRYRRSSVMAAADIGRLLSVLAFALGAADAPVLVPVLVALVLGFAGGIFGPAFGALVPELVPAEDLTKANALRSITGRAGQVLGPAVGGLILLVSDVTMAFWIDAATFAASVFTLIAVGDHKPVRHASDTIITQAKAGLVAVRERRWAYIVIVQGTLQLVLVMAPVVVLLPVLLQERHILPLYGLMFALKGLGAVFGGIVVAAWTPRRPGLIGLLGLALVGFQIFALMVNAHPVLLGASMLATGFGYSTFGVLWVSALQRGFPTAMHGRVFAIDSLGTFALEPLGLALAPIAALTFGNTAVLAVALVAIVATTVVPLLRRDVRFFAD